MSTIRETDDFGIFCFKFIEANSYFNTEKLTNKVIAKINRCNFCRYSYLLIVVYSLITLYKTAQIPTGMLKMSCAMCRVLTNISPYTWVGMGVAICVSSSVFGAATLVALITVCSLL